MVLKVGRFAVQGKSPNFSAKGAKATSNNLELSKRKKTVQKTLDPDQWHQEVDDYIQNHWFRHCLHFSAAKFLWTFCNGSWWEMQVKPQLLELLLTWWRLADWYWEGSRWNFSLKHLAKYEALENPTSMATSNIVLEFCFSNSAARLSRYDRMKSVGVSPVNACIFLYRVVRPM